MSIELESPDIHWMRRALELATLAAREGEVPVGALIVNPHSEIFLMRSHKWRDQYCIPGGHIEIGETIEQALQREVKEETGLDVYDIEFVCFQEVISDASFWKNRHFIFFDYACRTDSIAVTLNDEAESYVWVPLEKVPSLPVEQYTINVIETYIEKKGRGECHAP